MVRRRVPLIALGAGLAVAALSAAVAGASPPATPLRPATPMRPAPPRASAPPPAPTYSDAPCAKCHTKQLTLQKSLHTILRVGGCADCHVPSSTAGKCKGPVDKGWKLLRADPELCLECHRMEGSGPDHGVIKSGGCTVCHDPHGSKHPNLLVEEPNVALCSQCHPKFDDKPNTHTPVKAGECLGCHDPHRGVDKPLLRVPADRVCLECHERDVLLPDRVRHAPVVDGRCVDCHDPHGGKRRLQLKAEGSDLCLPCHDAKAPTGITRPGPSKRVDLKAKVVHPPLTTGDCQDCHEQTHSGKNDKLLKGRSADLCFECHEKADFKRKFVHGAVRMGECATCHSPHSSDQNKLLRDADIRSLCFRCHADDVTGRAFIHRPVADGKCTACHDHHGADYPFNLKQGVGKKVCLSCHKAPDQGRNKHKALERYGCVACHDPHGTANRFQLIKPVNALCQTCHTDKMDGTHVTTFVAGGHPITGGPDPHDPTRDYSCVSCHNPHGSDSPKLLRFGTESMDSCDFCHGDRSGKHPELKDIHARGRRGRPAPASVR